jgi:hypothetical protein
VVPPSFVALFIPSGRLRPAETATVIEQRYELCEDFAQMLLGQAQTRQWEWGITRKDVLQRVAQGLQDSDVFSADEAQWVLTRLEELLSC